MGLIDHEQEQRRAADEEAGALIEQRRAQELRTRRAAVDTLRQVLSRNDKPKKGDYEKLAQAMDALGVKTEQLPELLEVVQKLDRYEPLAAAYDEIRSEYGRAHKALSDVDQWASDELERVRRAVQERRAKLESEAAGPTARLRQAEEARQHLPVMQAHLEALAEGITPDQLLEREQRERLAKAAEENVFAVGHGSVADQPDDAAAVEDGQYPEGGEFGVRYG